MLATQVGYTGGITPNPSYGYTGGVTPNPSYEDVCSHTTGHAEAVEVEFDPAKVSYEQLVELFWKIHNPTQVNRQGWDIGDQYRSAIFTHSDEQARIATDSRARAQEHFRKRIATQIEPAGTFYQAEEYHQQCLEKRGRASCVIPAPDRDILDREGGVMAERMKPQKERDLPASEEEWGKRLTPEQLEVLRNKGTERAFTGKYAFTKDKGIYRCAGCGAELFDSDTEYESGTGWPSFWAPIRPGAVEFHEDGAWLMRRTEVTCARCGGHLGHVFDDGPQPAGERYCMNSCSLELDTAEQ